VIKGLIHPLPLLVLWTTAANAENLVWKTEPFAADCEEAAGPKLDRDGNLLDGEQDFVLHKCKTKYGPTMWLLYLDSARMSIGFGERPTATWTGASLNRGDWPIEWGGVESSGRFQPRSATIRLLWDTDQPAPSRLAVYKIMGDEPACLLAIVEPGQGENERARKVAESIDANTNCDRTADPLDDVTK